MSRRLMLAFVGALVVAAQLAAHTAGADQSANRESGNPINDQGSSYHYRTYVTSIAPRVRGLSVEVLEFADRLLVRNRTGQTVTIYGYSGEPYARIQPNGSAEQNRHSPAAFLNTNFYAQVTVPPYATATASPKWETVDRAGQFEWHDHRIHWMSPIKPPQVADEGKRTKIFDWSVPIKVGNTPGAINGELFWVPESSSAPTGAIVALIVVVVAGVLLVVMVRVRRRRSSSRTAAERRDAAHASGGREAW
jgi:hypothetical protein